MRCVFPSMVSKWQKGICITLGVGTATGTVYGATLLPGYLFGREVVEVVEHDGSTRPMYSQCRMQTFVDKTSDVFDGGLALQSLKVSTYGAGSVLFGLLSVGILKECPNGLKTFMGLIKETTQCCTIIRKTALFTIGGSLYFGVGLGLLVVAGGCGYVAVNLVMDRDFDQKLMDKISRY